MKFKDKSLNLFFDTLIKSGVDKNKALEICSSYKDNKLHDLTAKKLLSYEGVSDICPFCGTKLNLVYLYRNIPAKYCSNDRVVFPIRRQDYNV